MMFAKPGLLRPALLAALALLAACSNRGDETSATLKTLAALQAAATRAVSPDEAAAQPPLTRAVLNTIDGEFIQAEIEKTGSRAFMYISAERNGQAAGSEGGRLLVWRTENDVSLTLRDGVVMGTAQALALVPGVSRSGGTISAR